MKFNLLLKWAVAAMVVCGAVLSCTKSDATVTVKRDRARYTILIYGNAGARMDHVIEGVWEQLKPMLDDSTDVRVIVMYKYGTREDKPGEFQAKYGQKGDLMEFELTSETDLTKLHEETAIPLPKYELYDSKCLAVDLDYIKEYAPADNYILVLWGHGGGFDIVHDRPDNMLTKGVLYDETLDGKALNMYQLADALATGNTHFQCLMFHNCLMGNIETLTEVQPYADYFFVSTHVLFSLGAPVVQLVSQLKKSKNYDFEPIAKDMMTELRRIYNTREGFIPEMAENMNSMNLDFKMVRSSSLTPLNNNISFFVNRLLELYPTLSDEAKNQMMAGCIYSYEAQSYPYLIDLKKYVQSVASKINDERLNSDADDIAACLDDALFERWDSSAQGWDGLKEFSLSIMLPYHDFLRYPVSEDSKYTAAESYYPSSFNRRTGWARWMDANTTFPTKWTAIGPPPDFEFTWDYLKDVLENEKRPRE